MRNQFLSSISHINRDNYHALWFLRERKSTRDYNLFLGPTFRCRDSWFGAWDWRFLVVVYLCHWDSSIKLLWSMFL